MGLIKDREKFEALCEIMRDSKQPFSGGYADGRIAFFNDAFCELLGYTREEFSRLPGWTAYIPPEDHEKTFQSVHDFSKITLHVNYETQFVKKDGSRIFVMSSSHPAFVTEDGQMCYYAFVSDITEQKEARERLARFNHELEVKVAERTREAESNSAALREMLFAERVASDILYRFINVDLEKFETELESALRDMGRFFGVERSKILIFSSDFRNIDSSYEWRAEGVSRVDNRLLIKNIDLLTPIIRVLESKSMVCIPDVETSEAIVDRDFWRKIRVRSIICFPLFFGGSLGGLFALDSESEPKSWSDTQISSLGLIVSAFEGVVTHFAARKSLEESREIFRTFMNNFSEPAFIKDADSRYIFVNKAFEPVGGLPADKIVGLKSTDLFGSRDGGNFLEQDRKMLDENVFEDVEFESKQEVPGEGRKRYVVRKFVISRSDQPPLIGGIAFDISERKRMETALQKSEQRYRNLIEFAHEGYWLLDIRDRTTIVNRRMCEILGYSEGEMLGKHPSAFMDRNGSAMAGTIIKNCHEGIKTECSLEFVHKDGHRVYTHLNASPVYDAEGNYDGAFALITDLTRQKVLENEVSIAKKELLKNYTFQDMVGKSQAMTNIFETLHIIADADCNVLIEGPSGTGKSLVAKVIHTVSSRRDKPFVVVNCGTLPENLLESELFGYVKGAFTGADRDKPGKFAAASGGFIFLDEIGEMPLNLQVKLLRVLEDKCFEPIGSNRTARADVKIIAATNRDLQALVNEGRFRYDLFYRLKIVSFSIPPLRERPDDVEALTEYFMASFNEKYNKGIAGVSNEVSRFLRIYDYPGNIRELKNILERAFIFCDASFIEMRHLAPEYVAFAERRNVAFVGRDKPCNVDMDDGRNAENLEKKEAAFEFETLRNTAGAGKPEKKRADKLRGVSAGKTEWDGARQNNRDSGSLRGSFLAGGRNRISDLSETSKRSVLVEVIRRCGNNKSLAARELGIDKTTLWRRMKKLGLVSMIGKPVAVGAAKKRAAGGGRASKGSEAEKARISSVLKKCGGNRSKAARMLGIDRVTLWRRIRKYGLE